MEHLERHKRMTLENYLTAYFKKNHGVLLGETTVLSLKVHGNNEKTPGEIQIYMDQDAGRYYLSSEQENMFLHMDIFHEPARIDPVYVARRLKQGIELFFTKLREENRSQISKEYVKEISTTLIKNTFIRTALGKGNAYDLANRQGEFSDQKAVKPETHVHILLSLEPKYYDILIFIADAVEQAIISQGFEIRRVEKIKHCKRELITKPRVGVGLALPGFNSPESKKYRAIQNRLQIIMNLANSFGSIEETARFLESLTTTGNLFLNTFSKKHSDGGIKQTLLDLTNHNLVKKRPFAFVLTNEGKALRDFIRLHQKELEAHVRKSIRRYQIVRHNYQTYRNSKLKSRKTQITDNKKVISLRDNAWLSDMAIPETIVNAAVRSFFEKRPHLTIDKKDIMVFGKKSFAPIDTCIAIDCSGSMVGEKIRAVFYLAQHFLLTSKEKVSVITFNETDAKVVVPFTKSYQKLQEGLRTIQPEGLTPLAKGIVTSVEHIKSKRARNPLLILITDGIPNYPLWTIDAKKDALKAVEMVAETKIRLVSIGVIPNEDFMKELTEIGKGNLYIVDELDTNSLLDVVTREWQQYKYTK